MSRGKRSWVMLKGVKFCPTPAVCGLLLLCVLWGRVGGMAVYCRHGPSKRVAHNSPQSGPRGPAFAPAFAHRWYPLPNIAMTGAWAGVWMETLV